MTHCTPTYMIHTRRGTIPHLTNDNLQLVLQSCQMKGAIIHLNLFDMVQNFPPSLLSSHNLQLQQKTGKKQEMNVPLFTLHELLNFPASNYTLFLSIRDAQHPLQTQMFNDKYIMGDTESGRKKLTAVEFCETVRSYGCDVHVSMHDSGFGNGTGVPMHQYSKKRFAKALDRTRKWLQIQNEQDQIAATVASISHRLDGLILCPFNEHFDPVLQSAVQSIQSTNNNVHGIVLGDYSVMKPCERYSKLTRCVQYLNETFSGTSIVRVMNGMDHPLEILECVYHGGVDLFDGTYPFTCAEFGYASIYPLLPEKDAIIKDETDVMKMNLRNRSYRKDFRPILDHCPCWACKHHTRAYIHHLLNTHEMLAEVLLCMHNLHHYLQLFQTIQQQLKNGTFETYRKAIKEIWN